MARLVPVVNAFCSQAYWEARYRAGGNSGSGSCGALVRYKADVINAFVADNGIASVLDFGCGDGNLLSLLQVRGYIGVDVSPTALACCITRFPHHRFVPLETVDTVPAAELALSIDVIFHLVEDAVFARTIHALFVHATRFVLIYASNVDAGWPAPHVRHRRFTEHVAASQPGWRLLAHLPNPFPFEARRPTETSFADFFVYGRGGETCSIRLPP